MEATVPTRILILSDTHGRMIDMPTEPVDVLIHCGDLTEESKLHEFEATIGMLQQVHAPLKLVIPGNPDWTLDLPMFSTKLKEAGLSPEDDAVIMAYGAAGDARKLLKQSNGITLLDEGTHKFELSNGASLTVYASPYTPSTNDWGFQYNPQEDHIWTIGREVDVVITHGPPHGVFDQTESNVRAGCPSLFQAISQSRPQLHCFGHIHSGWGAKAAVWRDVADVEGKALSHFTAIDNGRSRLVESLTTLRARKFDDDARRVEKQQKLEAYTQKDYCEVVEGGEEGQQTIFVNAAIEGCDESYPVHLPWIVDITLPRASCI